MQAASSSIGLARTSHSCVLYAIALGAWSSVLLLLLLLYTPSILALRVYQSGVLWRVCVLLQVRAASDSRKLYHFHSSFHTEFGAEPNSPGKILKISPRSHTVWVFWSVPRGLLPRKFGKESEILGAVVCRECLDAIFNSTPPVHRSPTLYIRQRIRLILVSSLQLSHHSSSHSLLTTTPYGPTLFIVTVVEGKKLYWNL